MAIIASDNFERVDSAITLDSTPVGNFTWQKYGTQQWGIVGELAYPVTPLYDMPTYIDVGVSDNIAYQITETVFDVSNQLMWRIQNETNHFLLEENGVYSCINGTYVEIGNIGDIGDGSIVRIELRGTEHRFYVNGELRLTLNNSNFLTETKFGFSSNSYLTRYDDVLIETIGEVSDAIPPANVTNLTSSKTTTTVNLSWTNPTDPDFSHVRITRDGVEIEENLINTTYQDTGRTPNTSYNYVVQSVDIAGNVSAGSTINVTTNPISDTTPPENPTGLFATKTTTEVNLSWVNPTDLDFSHVKIVRNGVTIVENVTGTTYQDTGRTPNTSYNYSIQSVDMTGNISTGSTISVTTSAVVDTTPPENVTSLASSKTSNSVTLNWDNPLDSDFSHVRVLRDEVEIATNHTLSYLNDLNRLPNTSYKYTVIAVDTAGNEASGVSIDVLTNPQTSQEFPTIARDDFDRADSTTSLGSTVEGSLSWQYYGTQTWGIQNGQAYAITPMWDYPVYIDAGISNNVVYQVTQPVANGDNEIIWRIQDEFNYFLLIDGFIFSMVDGVYEELASIGRVNNGDVIRIELRGIEHQIYKNGTLVGLYNNSNFLNATKFGFSTNNNLSRFDDVSILGIVGADTTPPANPTGLSATKTTNSVSLRWVNPSDSDLSHIRVLRNGVEILGNHIGNTYIDYNRSPDTIYDYTVIAVDTSGNQSSGISLQVTTDKLVEMSPPPNIEELTASKTVNSVSLNWINPVDENFSHVKILRDGEVILNSYILESYTDTGRESNTEYVYRVISVSKDGIDSNGVSIVVTTNDDSLDETLPLVARDDFNRENNTVTLGSTPIGNFTWQHYGIQTWGIENNQAYAVSPLWDYPVYIDAGISAQVVYQITQSVFNGDNEIMWRIQDANNYFLLIESTVFSMVNGEYIELASIGQVGNGTVIRIELNGTEHKIYNNGTLATTFNDNNFLTATKFGFSTNNSLSRFDDFMILGHPNSEDNAPPPYVTSVEFDRDKISPASGMDMSILTFTFNKDVTQWTVNVMGSDHTTGIVADSGTAVPAGQEIDAVIDWTELYQEGDNRVNIYGRNTSGVWTPYNMGVFIDGGSFGNGEFKETYSGGTFDDTIFDRTIDGSTDRIVLRRGIRANLVNLDEGELGFCTDTRDLYIGTSNGNLLLVSDSGEEEVPPVGDLTDVTNLEYELVDGASVKLSWTNVSAATNYDVKINGEVVANVSGTPYITEVLTENTTHSIIVVSKNESGASNGVSVDVTTQTRTTPVYPTSLITTQEDVFVDYNIQNGTLRLSTDHGKTFSQPISKPFSGAVRYVHAFSDGTMVLFSENRAYYTTDFLNFQQSTILDTNGNPVTMSGNDKFYTTGYDLRTQVVDGVEMLVWGNYTTEAGVEWTSNIVLWYTIDKGATIKMARRFNTGDAPPSRHIHSVTQNPYDDSFWIASGDDTPTADWVRRGVYNLANDTWSWSVIGTGRDFKWGILTFIGEYVYWAWDVPSGGICRSLISEVSDVSKHTKLFTTPNDAISLSASERGELIVGQSIYGGTDRADKFWYSPDRINFYMINAPFFNGQSNRIGVWSAMRMTSQGKLSSGIWGDEIYWELQPRVFLDDYVKNAGFVNAFKTVGTENMDIGEVTAVNSSSTTNSATMSWTKPNNSYLSDVRVLRNGAVIREHILGSTFTDTGLSAGTTYTYTIQTVDISGKISEGVNRVITTSS